MKQVLSHHALHKWQRYSGHEKSTIVYVLVLACLFMMARFIKIDAITSETNQLFTIFNDAFSKSGFIILLCILFLIGWNASYKWKQLLHRAFGFSGSQTITNAFVLFVILAMVFMMGDTIGLLNQEYSYRISTTSWFLILGVYIIAGIAWQLIAARLQWKEQMMSEGITIKQEIDNDKKERDFQQMEKEFQGLFEGEKESNG